MSAPAVCEGWVARSCPTNITANRLIRRDLDAAPDTSSGVGRDEGGEIEHGGDTKRARERKQEGIGFCTLGDVFIRTTLVLSASSGFYFKCQPYRPNILSYAHRCFRD